MGGCRGPGGLIASLGQLRRPLPKVHARAVCLRGRFTGLPPCTLCARPRSGVRFGVDPRTCVHGGPCARSGAPHPTLAIGGASATRIHACILTPCRNLCVHAGPLHGGCAAAATPFAGGVQPSGGAWKSLRGLSDASRNECTVAGHCQLLRRVADGHRLVPGWSHRPRRGARLDVPARCSRASSAPSDDSVRSQSGSLA